MARTPSKIMDLKDIRAANQQVRAEIKALKTKRGERKKSLSVVKKNAVSLEREIAGVDKALGKLEAKLPAKKVTA